MELLLSDVNWITIIIAAVVNMIIGGLWYSPVLFGDRWIKLMGFSQKQIDEAKSQSMAKSYSLMAIFSVVMAFVLSRLIDMTGIIDIYAALILGFLLWLGFIATTKAGDTIFGKKPIGLYIIDAGYYLVSMLAMSAILTFIV